LGLIAYNGHLIEANLAHSYLLRLFIALIDPGCLMQITSLYAAAHFTRRPSNAVLELHPAFLSSKLAGRVLQPHRSHHYMLSEDLGFLDILGGGSVN
jgi:hypothetical protein